MKRNRHWRRRRDKHTTFFGSFFKTTPTVHVSVSESKLTSVSGMYGRGSEGMSTDTRCLEQSVGPFFSKLRATANSVVRFRAAES